MYESRFSYCVLSGVLLAAILASSVLTSGRAAAQQPPDSVIGRAIEALTGKKNDKKDKAEADEEGADAVVRKQSRSIPV